MNFTEEKLLRKYLLGELPPERNSLIEERLFLEPEVMELALLVESELMESYLDGELTDQAALRLSLSSPEQQKTLTILKGLRKLSAKAERRSELKGSQRPNGFNLELAWGGL